MNDRAVGLLEQYDIEVFRTRKGRGSILCDTAQGCLIFKEYVGNEEKPAVQDKLLRHIEAGKQVRVEQIIPTKEGAFLVKDGDNTAYILKTYCEGRECNIYDKEECLQAMRLLGQLHESMESVTDIDWPIPAITPAKEYEKRNRELKKVRKYLQQRSQKTEFEIKLLNTFDYFLKQALTVSEEWESYQKNMPDSSGNLYCHGDYQYHNILRCGDKWMIVNFEKCIPDSPIRDVYLLLRKLLEKGNWSVALGRELLSVYEQARPIVAMDYIDLYYRFAYPEKFWKITNFYYNSGKAWIPDRNREKLEKLMEQEKGKQIFLDEVFRNVPGCMK